VVPRADQTTVVIDLPIPEVSAQVPAAPRDGEALTVDVERRPVPNPADGSRSKLINGSD
jgi:hypothetical protein